MPLIMQPSRALGTCNRILCFNIAESKICKLPMHDTNVLLCFGTSCNNCEHGGASILMDKD